MFKVSALMYPIKNATFASWFMGKLLKESLGACCQFIAYKSPVVNLVYNSVIICHMDRFPKCSFSYWELDNLNATEYQYQSFTALCQSSLRICWAGVVTALENWVCSFPEDKYTIFETTYKGKKISVKYQSITPKQTCKE